MKYKCRTVKPVESSWYEVEASSPEEAANNFHTDNLYRLTSLVFIETINDQRHKVHFAKVEVEGYEEYVSRAYTYGIWRMGGVKRVMKTDAQLLKDIADALGWAHAPEELLGSGWDSETPLEELLTNG